MDYANIILEMLDRIKKLESEVESLKKNNVEAESTRITTEIQNGNSPIIPKMSAMRASELKIKPSKRDTTRYMFAGNVYLKNRLVLAVVQEYLKGHPDILKADLKRVFSKSLQGSIGVVEEVEIATKRIDYEIRFFVKPNEVLHLCDGDMYVCNQWGVLNIVNFLKVAEQLGYEIESI